MPKRRRKPPERVRLPETRKSVTHKVVIYDPTSGAIDIYLIAGEYPCGCLGELFVKVGKWGSTLHGLLDAIGVETSLLLQYGIPVSRLADKLKGMRFIPAGPTDNPDVPECQSIVDYIFQWLEGRYGQSPEGCFHGQAD